MNKARGLILLAAASLLAACTLADEFNAEKQTGISADYSADAGAPFRQTTAGKVLTTPDGMTVYTYDKEVPGSPSCYGGCAEDWSPVVAPPNAKPVGKLTLLARIDGAKQWAYEDLALYIYKGDKKPGEATGDNQDDGVWHVVKARQ